ncbi:TetR/AcrR family transcriptional regulator [Alcaligenaceae bacterium A4P071]|nr:TetR/AcrR family transcriptional regulator [Alcaligenaceae bacterium A4P071]
MSTPLSDALPAAQTPGQRGPPQHEMRDRIVERADARFRHYGFGKTTIAEIAADLDVSTAYVYKFFDSKLAICEAVCSLTLATIERALNAVAYGPLPSEAKFAALYDTLLAESLRLFFNERKLHDMVDVAMNEGWQAIENHKATMAKAIGHIVEEGRQAGVFETDTALDETTAAILSTMACVAHPKILQQTLDDDIEFGAQRLSALVLRGIRR